jgi:hypothetical protein
VDQPDDALERHSGEIRKRFLEKRGVAGQQRAEDEPGSELAGGAQMPDQPVHFGLRCLGSQHDGCFLASLLGDTHRAILGQPVAGRNEASERFGEFCDQSLPRRSRQIIARKQDFANRRKMTETLDDAIDGKHSDLCVGILKKQEAGFGRADLGDRGGNRSRQEGAARDRSLGGGTVRSKRIDELGIEQKRRMFQDDV